MRPSLLLLSILQASTAPLYSSALSTVTVTASSSSAARSKPSDSASYKDLGLFQKAILASHNVFRDQHNATALGWNHSLASSGLKWAKGCVFKHSGGPSGENLAAGYANATAAVSAWAEERKMYNFAKQGFTHETGHFTQVVWKNTRTVGCGNVLCLGKNDVPGW
ncbi:MAG: hypothetical protein M1816_000488 [Peltula sp. TS41687]|nr:MAG: hypothetical protein M1816_000488 [Peltula sp. TS41687]